MDLLQTRPECTGDANNIEWYGLQSSKDAIFCIELRLAQADASCSPSSPPRGEESRQNCRDNENHRPEEEASAAGPWTSVSLALVESFASFTAGVRYFAVRRPLVPIFLAPFALVVILQSSCTLDEYTIALSITYVIELAVIARRQIMILTQI